MGGFHIVYRTTKEGKYCAIGSELSLPMVSSMQDNPRPEYKGTHPEFFHGFYSRKPEEKTGIDVGVIFSNGTYKLFSFCYEASTTGATWQEADLNFNGGTLLLNSYIVPSTQTKSKILRTEAAKNGIIYGTIDLMLSDISYSDITSGCFIHRELSMATNYHNMSGNAKFPWTSFGNSTLTDVYGTYHKLSSANSEFANMHESMDSGTSTSGFTKGTAWGNYTEMVGDYIADAAWGDCTVV